MSPVRFNTFYSGDGISPCCVSYFVITIHTLFTFLDVVVRIAIFRSIKTSLFKPFSLYTTYIRMAITAYH